MAFSCHAHFLLPLFLSPTHSLSLFSSLLSLSSFLPPAPSRDETKFVWVSQNVVNSLTRSYCRQLPASTSRRVSQDGCEVRSAASTSAAARRRSLLSARLRVSDGARREKTTGCMYYRRAHRRCYERSARVKAYVLANVSAYEWTTDRPRRGKARGNRESRRDATRSSTDASHSVAQRSVARAPPLVLTRSFSLALPRADVEFRERFRRSNRVHTQGRSKQNEKRDNALAITRLFERRRRSSSRILVPGYTKRKIRARNTAGTPGGEGKPQHDAQTTNPQTPSACTRRKMQCRIHLFETCPFAQCVAI